MFARLVTLFFLICLAAGAANWLAAQPGSLSIEWLGWQMEMRSSLAVAVAIIFGLSLVFIDRLQRALRAMPRWLGGRWRQRRDKAGHRALTLGLVAVSAGESTEACKQAARAHRLLDAPQLTALLSAQSAHLAGDHAAARRYFRALLDDQDTAFLGQIGLMRLALDAKDSAAALDAASKALELKPQSGLAATQLLQLHVDQQRWADALEVMAIVTKDRIKHTGTVPEILLQQRIALLYLEGMKTLQAGSDAIGAARRFEAALSDNPAFLPAVFALANIYLDMANQPKAVKLLEKSFTLVPHRGISDMLQTLWNDNDGHSLARLIRLIPKRPLTLQHAAYKIVSDIATSKGLEGEARRFCELHDSSFAAFGWQCTVCKSRHEDWHSHCQSCENFAGLKWQQPEKVTPLLED